MVVGARQGEPIVEELRLEVERLRRRVAELEAAPPDVLDTLAAAIASIPAAVAVIRGSDFRLQLVNPAYQALAPGRVLVGSTLAELWPRAAHDFTALCRRVLETGTEHVVHDERTAVRPRRGAPLETRWFNWSLHRVHLGGEGWGLLNIALDTTALHHADEALHHSNERLALAREAAGLGIYDYDIVADHLVWDARTRALWGLGPDEPVSIDRFVAGMHPDDRAAARGAALAARDPDSPGVFRIEYRVIHAGDGAERWVSSTGQVVFEGRRAVRVVGTLQDITERKEAEHALRASEARLRTFFHSDLIGALYWTMDGRITDANDKFLRMVGYTRQELEAGAVNWEAMTPPEYRAADEHALAELRATGIDTPYEKEYLRKDGSRAQILIGAAMVDEQRQEGVAFVLDISERKRAEAAAAAAKAAAEEANRQKDHFLAMLGHELRNPLAPIRNTVAVLQRTAPADARLARSIGVIERQVAHMTRLIDDLLDVSRIARGKIKLRLEEFDLAQVVRAAVDDHRPFFETSGIALGITAPPWPLRARGDSARVAQIVANLVVNANKFTNRGGSVSVEVTVPSPHVATITVRDTGVGIDPGTLASIFEPFAQGDVDIARSAGGLGLGLALVKGLSELHGGSVSVRSDGTGCGAEFVVTLPILLLDAQLWPAEAPARPQPGRSKRILIVEDNVDAAETLSELLQLLGHSLAVVHSGTRALQAALVHQPDVVLCDIGLPDGMDGYAVARALRSEEQFRRVQLIAMTGYGLEEDKARARAAGFDRHLTKPVDPELLQSVLAA